MDHLVYFWLFRYFLIIILYLFLVFWKFFIIIFKIYIFYNILGLLILLTFFNKKLIILIHSTIYILVIRGVFLKILVFFVKISGLTEKRTNKLIFVNEIDFWRGMLLNELILFLKRNIFPIHLLLYFLIIFLLLLLNILLQYLNLLILIQLLNLQPLLFYLLILLQELQSLFW